MIITCEKGEYCISIWCITLFLVACATFTYCLRMKTDDVSPMYKIE